MKIELKNKIIDSYREKLLGYCSYKENIYYDSTILSEIKELHNILIEVNSHESDLTKEGISFLEEYYGFGKLAEYLACEGGIDAEHRTQQDIERWLKELKRYIVAEER